MVTILEVSRATLFLSFLSFESDPVLQIEPCVLVNRTQVPQVRWCTGTTASINARVDFIDVRHTTV